MKITVHPKTTEKITRRVALSLWESLLQDMGSSDPAVDHSRTAEGRRFLALAATLVTTMSPINSARTLNRLLQSNKSDLTVVLSTSFLTPIVETIRARYSKLGFTDEIIYWHWKKPHHLCGPSYPTCGDVNELVEAFNCLDGKDLTNVEISTELGHRVSIAIAQRSEVDGEDDVWAVDTLASSLPPRTPSLLI